MTGSDEASSKDSFLSKVTRRIENGEDDGTDCCFGYGARCWNAKICWRIAALLACLSLFPWVMVVWFKFALNSHKGSLAYGEPKWDTEPLELVGGSWGGLASLSGDYDLTSVSHNYEDYLMKLGVPESMVPFVMSSKESFHVRDNGDGSFRTKMVTAFDEMNVEFRLDEPYELTYLFNSGKMINHCTRPKPHILLVKSYEPSKKWNLTQEMVFTKYGMINTQFFVQGNSRAKKYYTKVVLSKMAPY